MKTVFVALDGSTKQAGVLDAAASIATRSGASLVAFRAVSMPTELPPDAHLMEPAQVTVMLEERARAAVDQAVATLSPTLRCVTRVVVGTPWDAICREAREADADLIVIGSHGYDALDRVLGTTAAKVVNHADRAVLVVRDPARLTR